MALDKSRPDRVMGIDRAPHYNVVTSPFLFKYMLHQFSLNFYYEGKLGTQIFLDQRLSAQLLLKADNESMLMDYIPLIIRIVMSLCYHML